MPAKEQHAVFVGQAYEGITYREEDRAWKQVKLWGNVPGISNEIVSMTMDCPYSSYDSGGIPILGGLTSKIFEGPFGRNLRLVSVRLLNDQKWRSIIEYKAVHTRPAPQGQPDSIEISGLRGLEVIKDRAKKLDLVAVTIAFPNVNEPVQQPLLCNQYSSNDVVFVFPNSSRVAPYLWARVENLTAVSTYWKTMFESGFSEANSELANVGEWQQKMRQDLKSILASHREPTSPHSKAKSVGLSSDDAERAHDRIRCIGIKETPLPTYRAVLTWITHKDISFAALREQPADDPSSEVQPSALDVYKLAHQLQMSDLMELSLGYYRTQLNATNAITQLFSTPAYLYPELRAAALKATVEHWVSMKNKGGMAAVQQAITAGGNDAQVVAEIVVELMKKISV